MLACHAVSSCSSRQRHIQGTPFISVIISCRDTTRWRTRSCIRSSDDDISNKKLQANSTLICLATHARTHAITHTNTHTHIFLKRDISQPAYNVGMTLIISCIYVATSNNTNATFSQRLVIDVTRTWKFYVATTLKSSRQPSPTSSQRLVIKVIRTWKFDIHATL